MATPEDAASAHHGPATLDRVPIVDISPFLHGSPAERAAVADLVDRTNREIGFLVITGHGFDLELLDRWFEISRRFFEGPGSAKRAVMHAGPTAHHGYHGQGLSGLAAKEGEEAPPDLREYFMIGQTDLSAAPFRTPEAGRFHRPNLWPDEPAEFAAVGGAYYAAISRLGAELMRLFAVSLGLPEHWFDDKIDHHFSIVSSIYYPEQKTAPLPGQLRAGAHTDYGSLTILAPTAAPGGLQVRTLQGEWVDVPHVPGAFVINIGDMMQRWTNDRWLSNMHRVVNPPSAVAATSPRQSIAFFLHPNHDAVIECIPTCIEQNAPAKYPAILAGEYMIEKEAAIATATTKK
ncbi:Isopenicillin N synthase [Pseudoxanthobacter soli DSM 19599]|uniref:2-oxoglutarate-dependent ethylene/succinate-forming enzyme n=1 Tax=Pseudoxanthobacter soli DSM 19599 TaxID=1123029 RepID=A0A1M7ZLA9_9HYPH|nr:2OG-Fe(II) oxygenase family protein [Pseudoxanthobacter soli]SHO65602.1 Isopenicillin N synthase [Pseudoxanthobacter soli DSM 19599]